MIDQPARTNRTRIGGLIIVVVRSGRPAHRRRSGRDTGMPMTRRSIADEAIWEMTV